MSEFAGAGLEEGLTTTAIKTQMAVTPKSNRYGSRCLTQRQVSVVALVARGYRNKDVAKALGTTEQTIKNYLHAVFDKLGMSNRVELTLWHYTKMKAAQKKSGCQDLSE